jgi:phosphoribosylanthranilate isomerase
MKRFAVKVCGITRAQDASLAARSGADMIGLIFYRRSPRFVSLGQAEAILKVVPPLVHRVGVFVDEDPRHVVAIAQKLQLDFVQVHGSISGLQIGFIRRAGFKVIRSFTVRREIDYSAVEKSPADLKLLDNSSAGLPGGTGRVFDWSINPRRRIVRLMIAGGITRDNVAEAVRIFRPTAIDVNSGVESRPGIKSSAKLRAFMERCNEIRYGIKED